MAFKLYCQLSFGRLHSRNPDIIKYAELIGRTPSSLAMKLVNIASLDPLITLSGRKGLKKASGSDRKMWEEMQNDWAGFIEEVNLVVDGIEEESQDKAEDDQQDERDFSGKNKLVESTVRIRLVMAHSIMLRRYCMAGSKATTFQALSGLDGMAK